MNWYTQEQIAERRRVEFDRELELKRQTRSPRRLPHYWLLATMRTWIISATR
ncbi:MAG TPA: hypothetical protein VNA65_06125 [Candidatus Dormibacteraeota bacterium]|nr:hypothetical protein [Candidatus Dormibacteraeota bacterium]